MKTKYRGAWAISEIILYCLFGVFLFAAGWIGTQAYWEANRNNKARADTAMLSGRISQYRFEVGNYPSSLANLQNSVGQYGPWLHDLPEDPWSRARSSYSYFQDANGCVVFSVGKNGASESSVAAGVGGDDVGFFLK